MLKRVLTVCLGGIVVMSTGIATAAEVVVSDGARGPNRGAYRSPYRYVQATGVPTPAGDPALLRPPVEPNGVTNPYTPSQVQQVPNHGVQPHVPNAAPHAGQMSAPMNQSWPQESYGSEEVYGAACGDWGCDCGTCDGSCGGTCGNGSDSEGPWFVDFWVASGFTGNPDDPNNESNLPVSFNDRANEYLLNQLYVSMGRNVATEGMFWDAGGRVDLLFGSDYFFTQSLGLETRDTGAPRWNRSGPRNGGTAAIYGLAMPQLYAEFYAPVGPGLNIKLGHFYTTIGYESVMAPENFFYSHAYTMQYGEPFTHTGMLVDWSVGERLGMHAGFTRGWDTWEDPNSDLGFLGGLSWTSPSKLASLALTLHTSNEDAAALNNRSVYSVVYTRRIGSNLRYVLQHDFGTEEGAEIGRNQQAETAKWYGLNQYLFYELSDALTLGTRIEWFRDQDNARVLAIPIESQVNGGNYTALTFGANWAISDRLTLRPEMRWDWSDVEVPSLGRTGMYNDFRDDDQFTIGSDLIFRY